MQLNGHFFRDFKSVEQICWACGYVIPRGLTPEEAETVMREMDGDKIACGGEWHKLKAAHG